MTIQQFQQTPETTLKRIDAIVSELLALRQEVSFLIQNKQNVAMPSQESFSIDLAEELYGSLGQGTLDEIQLDIDTKWNRFSQSALT